MHISPVTLSPFVVSLVPAVMVRLELLRGIETLIQQFLRD